MWSSCYPPQKPGCSLKMSFPLTPSFFSYLFLLPFFSLFSLPLLACSSLSFVSPIGLSDVLWPLHFSDNSLNTASSNFPSCLSSQTFPYLISSSAFPFPLHCNSSLPPSLASPFILSHPHFSTNRLLLSPLIFQSITPSFWVSFCVSPCWVCQPCPSSLSAVTIPIRP